MAHLRKRRAGKERRVSSSRTSCTLLHMHWWLDGSFFTCQFVAKLLVNEVHAEVEVTELCESRTAFFPPWLLGCIRPGISWKCVSFLISFWDHWLHDGNNATFDALLPGIQLKAPWGLTLALESKSPCVALNFAKAKGMPTLLRSIFLKRSCHETFCHRCFASAWVVQSRTQLQCRLCDSLAKCNHFQSCTK